MQACPLPEQVAIGFEEVIGQLRGAEYIPVLYVGKQVVNVTNYMIICRQILADIGADVHIVKMVLHETLKGEWCISRIEEIA